MRVASDEALLFLLDVFVGCNDNIGRSVTSFLIVFFAAVGWAWSTTVRLTRRHSN